MADSIVVLGARGCGKTLNAKALAKAFGFNHWTDADMRRRLPTRDHLILANHADVLSPACRRLRVVPFAEAIKRVPNPHPSTPAATGAGR